MRIWDSQSWQTVSVLVHTRYVLSCLVIDLKRVDVVAHWAALLNALAAAQ